MHCSLLPAKCFTGKLHCSRLSIVRLLTVACSSIMHRERSVSIATLATRRRHNVRFHLRSISSSNNKSAILQPLFSTSLQYAKYSKTCEYGHLCKSATYHEWSHLQGSRNFCGLLYVYYPINWPRAVISNLEHSFKFRTVLYV